MLKKNYLTKNSSRSKNKMEKQKKKKKNRKKKKRYLRHHPNTNLFLTYGNFTTNVMKRIEISKLIIKITIKTAKKSLNKIK